MSRRDPPWAHFARAAAEDPRLPAPAAVTPERAAPVRVRDGLLAVWRSRRSRDTARTMILDQVRNRPDFRLVPAVVATWCAAIFAIQAPWNLTLPLAALLLLLAGLGAAAILWRSKGSDAVQKRLPELPECADRVSSPMTNTHASGRALAVLVVVCALSAGLVVLAAALQTRAHTESPLGQAIGTGEDLKLTLKIDAVPRLLTGSGEGRRYLVEATVVAARAGGVVFGGKLAVRVMADARWAAVPEGGVVTTAGRINPADPYDGVAGYLRPATAPLYVQPAQPGGVTGLRSSWRDAVKGVWAVSSPDTAGLLTGMVMGDRSGISPGLQTDMKAVGLTHLTAVSGANCTLVMAGLLLALRGLRLPRAPASFISVLGLIGFVAVVGPDPSVLRAALMGAIGALAMLSGRPKRVGALLALSIVLLLLMDPWLALDFAFILSVLATLGLHLVGRRCAGWLSRWLPLWLAQAVAIPVAAQLFCAPVIVMLQPQLSLFAVPANLAAAPVVALVTVAGTIGLVLAASFPWVATGCAAVAGLGAWWVGVIARWMAQLPGALLPWPDGPGGVALMVLLNALLLGGLAVLADPQRASELLQNMRAHLPPSLRFLTSFPGLTTMAASVLALFTWMLNG